MLFSLLIGQEEKTTKNKCASKVYSKLSPASPSPLSFFQQRRSQRKPNAKTPAGCWSNFLICYLYKNQEIFQVGKSLCYTIVIYIAFFYWEKKRSENAHKAKQAEAFKVYLFGLSWTLALLFAMIQCYGTQLGSFLAITILFLFREVRKSLSELSVSTTNTPLSLSFSICTWWDIVTSSASLTEQYEMCRWLLLCDWARLAW